MSSFKKYYRSIFETFGYSLSKHTSMSSKVLTDTEKRLGIKIPKALRDYYLVAGNVKRFDHSHNHFLHPSEWEVDKQKLIFLIQKTGDPIWGVSLRNPTSVDPLISEGTKGNSISWSSRRWKCSIFISRMLHLQAVCGASTHSANVDLQNELNYSFEEEGWSNIGNIYGIYFYSRPNQVVCLVTNDSGMVGAKTYRDFKTIINELKIVSLRCYEKK
jgi:hypothetical protein